MNIVRRKNPLDTAEQLLGELEEARSCLPLGRAAERDLDSAIHVVRELVEGLGSLNDNYVSLDLGSDGAHLEAVSAFWAAVEAGVYRAGAPELERLTTSSPTLRALEASGVSVTSVRRFGEAELGLAAAIGDSFARKVEAQRALRQAAQKGGYVKFRQGIEPEVRRLVGVAERLGALEVDVERGLEMYGYRDKKWVPIAKKKVRYLKPGQPLRVHVRWESRHLRDVVRGHWMPAYVASVVRDHAERNVVPCSVLTEVAFRMPADVCSGAGDLDVVVTHPGGALFIECKSGRIDLDRGDLEPLVRNARLMRRIVADQGIADEIGFALVFNHHASDEGAIRAAMREEGIAVARLDEVRSLVGGMCSSRFVASSFGTGERPQHDQEHDAGSDANAEDLA